MFGLGMGRLGLTGGNKSLQKLLWPTGTEPGLWIAPQYTAESFQTSTGTTPLSAIGTVLDTSNPVGLILDRKGGATVLADPGLHLSQATSAARPVASARVNLLTKTDALGTSPWANVQGVSTYVANKIIPAATTLIHGRRYQYPLVNGRAVTISCLVKAGDAGVNLEFWTYVGFGAIINPTTWAVTGVTGCTVTLGDFDTDGYRRVFYTFTENTSGVNNTDLRLTRSTSRDQQFVGDGSSGLYVKSVQLNTGSVALPYQAVDTDSSYTATGFPVYSKLDGTDDALASATVAAGVVGNSDMTCLMAVRRDTAANCVAGLYNAVADATKFFGMCESGSGSTCVGSGAGTPTVWVDGVQLTGGTAVTRATLNTALTAGAWHILEFRGLDLSTWTAAGFGVYTSYTLNGANGGKGIMLFPSTTEANLNRARTELAASVGLVL